MYKIFLAEDEIVVRNGIKKLIPWEEYGFEFVGEASDGEMALPLIRELKPNVVFTDIKMPFMDGIELSRAVKEEMPEVKIVIFSGYDDFKYAKEAMAIGVSDYLLKPVSREDMEGALNKLFKELEEEREKKDYYSRFEAEIQEYEQYERRAFFEKLISGKAETKDAERLGLDLNAKMYGVILFRLGEYISEEGYSEREARLREEIEELFIADESCVLFKENINGFAALVMGESKEEVKAVTEKYCGKLKEIFGLVGISEKFVEAGEPQEGISGIKKSYRQASKAMLKGYTYVEDEDFEKNAVEASVKGQEIVTGFLKNGMPEETAAFVNNYTQSIGRDHMKSVLFRQYMILNVQFTALAFAEKLGVSEEDFFGKSGLNAVFMESMQTLEKAESYMTRLLDFVMELRNEKANTKYKSIVRDAIKYINEHYNEEDISLNRAARSINISPSYLSAVFSREVGKTFVEYLTNVRMEKAKKLLKETDMRSSEIAYEVGYNDPHYFSFLFKKTQGKSSRAYRSGIKEGEG